MLANLDQQKVVCIQEHQELSLYGIIICAKAINCTSQVSRSPRKVSSYKPQQNLTRSQPQNNLDTAGKVKQE